MSDDVRIDAAALVGALGDWSADGAGRGRSLYVRLGDRLAALIEAGTLPARTVLPPERVLAAALPASRGTVVAAYNRLADAGSVERRQGRGTSVRSGNTPSQRRSSLAAGLRAAALTDRMVHPVPTQIDLAMSVLDEPVPAHAADVDPDVLAAAGQRHGYLSLGIDALRDRVAELFTVDGFPTTRDEVIITNGAQHAVALAAALFVRPGTVVVIDDPGFPPAIDLYSRLGARFGPVDADSGGTRPSSVAAALRGTHDALVHLMPAMSSPTGRTTAATRRTEIGSIVADHDAWLLEDDALRHLAPDAGPPIGARHPDRSLVAGSCSKLFWGGLRVGWLRAPASVIERLGAWRSVSDLGTAIGPQVTALRLLDDVDEAVAVRQAEAAARRDHLVRQLADRIPDAVVERPAGGLSLWIELPGIAADRVAAAAATAGLAILRGDACSVSGGSSNAIRMSFWADPAVLDEAVTRLRGAIDVSTA